MQYNLKIPHLNTWQPVKNTCNLAGTHTCCSVLLLLWVWVWVGFLNPGVYLGYSLVMTRKAYGVTHLYQNRPICPRMDMQCDSLTCNMT